MKNSRNGLVALFIAAFPFWTLACWTFILPNLALADVGKIEPKYRQPKDLLLDASNEHLLVACSETGELEVYQTQSNERIACLPMDVSIDALASLGGNWIAACSTKSNQTHILHWSSKSLQRIATISNSYSPVHLHWDGPTQTLFVACLWSRRVDRIDLQDELKGWTAQRPSPDSPPATLQPDQVWDVPIAPRNMQNLNGGRGLIVADSFGREMVIMDPVDGHIIVSHDFFGTSIRGLTLHGQQLVTLHAMLNEYSQTNQNQIHWGVLMANDVRLVDVDLLLKERGDRIYVGGRVNPVGIPGNGSAEPTDLAVHATTGNVAVAVGGTDIVALGRIDGYSYKYVSVGRYPSSVEWSSDGKTVYVANQFDDTISVIDVAGSQVSSVISQGAMRKLSESELGEQLFHSATLSHDRWLTCASCHVDGHTNGQLSDNFGDRSFGAPKRVPSLLGVKDTAPFTWLGHEPRLQGQIVASIRKTMHSYRKLDDDEVENLAAFMESLPPVISLSKARGVRNHSAVERGEKLFQSRGCSDCHAGQKYTSNDVYDVGLVDENRQSLFNPPSLIGVSQRGPELFHNGGANGLRGVLVDKKHRLQEPQQDPLTDQQVDDLIAFLTSL